MLQPYVETRRINLKPIGCLSEKELRKKLQESEFSLIDGVEGFLTGNIDAPGELLGHICLEQARDSSPMGLASVHRVAGSRSGVVQMFQDNGSLVHGAGVEMNLLLMNYLFATWDLERVYFSPDSAGVDHVSNYPGMVDKVAHGDMPVPAWDDGRAIFSMRRENWENVGSKFLSVLAKRISN